MAVSTKRRNAVCKLGNGFRLSCDGHGFVLQEFVNNAWVDKFFYTWVVDALRGYVNYSLQVLGKLGAPDAKKLLMKLESIETEIKRISENPGGDLIDQESNKVHKEVEVDD